METSATEDLIPSEPIQTAPEAPQPSRLECLGGVIVSPLKTFEHLADRPQWFFPLLVAILYMIVGYVGPMVSMFAVSIPGIIDSGGSGTTEAFRLVIVVIISSILIVFALVCLLAVFSAMAGALYLITRSFKLEPRFYALAATLACAELVPRLVGVSIKQFVALFTGDGSPFSPELPTGIAPIFSELDLPILVQTILARIELFHLWSFALVVIAIRFVAKVSNERAMLITLVYWAVCILSIAGVGMTQEALSSMFD